MSRGQIPFSELFPNRQILGTSKLKEFAGNSFKFDENGESSPKG